MMNWVPVTESMPEPGVPVIAFVAPNSKIIRAQHVPPMTLEQSPDCDGGVYDEATDCFYCEEGWYETNEFEDAHWNVDGTVTHWMSLPLPPEVPVR